ncbi:MAG: hypothetical protein N2589_03255 [bacterium]|nr:hypothetical protein [bacterium]MCX7917126.1 hypothetical protein [bacterium]MDW8163922.1 hypothetical protein [Candidatus Omnitrophota bacterium]
MIRYKNLSEGKWFELSFPEQMANIGMEVLRAINWKNKNEKYFDISVEKVIELIDLTKIDSKNRKRLKEICRLKEVLIDYFWRNNQFKSSDKLWENYFNFFLYYASKLREKRRLECQK